MIPFMQVKWFFVVGFVLKELYSFFAISIKICAFLYIT